MNLWWQGVLCQRLPREPLPPCLVLKKESSSPCESGFCWQSFRDNNCRSCCVHAHSAGHLTVFAHWQTPAMLLASGGATHWTP